MTFQNLAQCAWRHRHIRLYSIYCLIYICWGVAGWHHRLSLGVNCGSRGPARTAPVWSLSLYVFSFSSLDESSIGVIHKRRHPFFPTFLPFLPPTSPLLKPLNYQIIQMFPDFIPLITWNIVTSFMDDPSGARRLCSWLRRKSLHKESTNWSEHL